MRTIAVIARKGGSGKSTVALHLPVGPRRRRSVEELDGQPEAAQEIAALYDFVSGFVFGRGPVRA